MNFIERINEYKDKILGKILLVEYDLFSDKGSKDYCNFVIDEDKNIFELDNILSRIKKFDKDTKIYVCTYGVDFYDNEICIYGDTIWINTILSIEKINEFFKNYKELEPSDIVLLSENETIDGEVAMVFLSNGNVEDYKSFSKKIQFSTVKSIYWD